MSDNDDVQCPICGSLTQRRNVTEIMGESSFAAPAGSVDWQRVTNDLPKLGDVCWLWDGKTIWLGGREMVDSDQWMWGNSYGHVWHNGAKWDADNETDDDYRPTHWMALPNPPNTELTAAVGQATC